MERVDATRGIKIKNYICSEAQTDATKGFNIKN